MSERPQIVESDREHAIENVAMFLAFQVRGYDESWAFAPPEMEEQCRFEAEVIVQLALGEKDYDGVVRPND